MVKPKSSFYNISFFRTSSMFCIITSECARRCTSHNLSSAASPCRIMVLAWHLRRIWSSNCVLPGCGDTGGCVGGTVGGCGPEQDPIATLIESTAISPM